MTKHIRILVAVIIAASLVTACETRQPRQQTSVDRVFMKPGLDTIPYERVLIIGAVPTRETARRIEIAVNREMSGRPETFLFVRDSDATEPGQPESRHSRLGKIEMLQASPLHNRVERFIGDRTRRKT